MSLIDTVEIVSDRERRYIVNKLSCEKYGEEFYCSPNIHNLIKDLKHYNKNL